MRLYDLYLCDLRIVLNLLPVVFYHPSELRQCREISLADNWSSKDIWLRNTADNRVALGLDILKRGTYWPLIINNRNEVYEGNHRIWALKELDRQGLVPKDRRFMCIRASNYALDVVHDEPQVIPVTSLFIPQKTVYTLSPNMVTHIRDMGDIREMNTIYVKGLIQMLSNFSSTLRGEVYHNAVKPYPIFSSERIFREWHRGQQHRNPLLYI